MSRALRPDLLAAPEVAALTAYAPPEGDFPIRLDANESPADLPEDLREALRTALAAVPFHRYPDPACRGLRRAFAARFGCRPGQVMVGNGSDELIALLLWTFRRGRDGGRPRILVPVPTFSMYALIARAAGFEVVEVPLRRDLTLDAEAMVAAARDAAPNLVFLSSPNNPTGTLFAKDEVESVLESSPGLVVVDEAYADFAPGRSRAAEVSGRPNLAVLRTLSKVRGAALRCGFLVAGEEVLAEVDKVRLPFNVNALTQAAGLAMLERWDRVAALAREVAEERERLRGGLSDLGLEVFPSSANFLLVRAHGREEALWRFLQEGGIVVKSLPRLRVAGDALRITVGAPSENRALLDRVAAFR